MVKKKHGFAGEMSWISIQILKEVSERSFEMVMP
jgi:hypothetical protein